MQHSGVVIFLYLINQCQKTPPFLSPAKVVCEGYVCKRVCHSVHTGGTCVVAQGGMRGCLGGGVHGCSWGACKVAARGACMVAAGGHAWLLLGGVCGMRRDTEIRSMSGRYLSYWNAFI